MQAIRYFKLGIASLLVAAAWPASAGLVTTLPTNLLNANARLDFSEDAVGALDLAGVTRTALGTATAIGTTGASFNLPVTSATTELSLFPLSLTSVAGTSNGAALELNRGAGKDLIIANAALDFKNKKLSADVYVNGVKTSLSTVYTFDIAQGLSLSTKGGLTLHEVVNHLTLTSEAVDTFASALGLKGALKATLGSIDYGSITIDISPTLRLPLGSVSGKPYTPPPVPEPSTYALVGLGLLVAAKVARRKSAA
jgi:hypothetical protein